MGKSFINLQTHWISKVHLLPKFRIEPTRSQDDLQLNHVSCSWNVAAPSQCLYLPYLMWKQLKPCFYTLLGWVVFSCFFFFYGFPPYLIGKLVFLWFFQCFPFRRSEDGSALGRGWCQRLWQHQAGLTLLPHWHLTGSKLWWKSLRLNGSGWPHLPKQLLNFPHFL